MTITDPELRDMIARISDKAGETLAVFEDVDGLNGSEDPADRSNFRALYTNVQELHLLIWRLRWGAGVGGGAAVAPKGGAS